MIVEKPALLPSERRNDEPEQAARWFMMVVAAGLAWRLARLGLHFEITGDESGILRSVMERGYAQLLEPLSYSNVSPPLFLWATKFIEGVFQCDWAARALPFLAGLGAVAVFGLICRAALAGLARWVAWAVFCVAYVPVVESTRAKGYAIDLFVATVMLWLMLRWLQEGRKARFLFALALCAPVFVWLSYTSVFIIGAVVLVFATCLAPTPFFRDGASAEGRSLGWSNALAGLAFMALAAVSAFYLYKLNVGPGLAASHNNGLADAWKRGFPPDEPWRIPLWLVWVQTGRGFAWPVGGNHCGSVLSCALWLTGLIVYWRRGDRRVWALFVAPQILSLAAGFLHKYPYLQDPRLCVFLGPGICLFIGCGAQYLIDSIPVQRTRRRCYAALAIILALCALGGLGLDIVLRIQQIRGPGIRSVLAAACRRVGPDGQFDLLNDPGASGVFTYYLKREVKQKVWLEGQMPSPTMPGQRLALVVATSNARDSNPDTLFADFQRRWGRPLKVIWSQTAGEVLLDSNDRLVVWVCE